MSIEVDGENQKADRNNDDFILEPLDFIQIRRIAEENGVINLYESSPLPNAAKAKKTDERILIGRYTFKRPLSTKKQEQIFATASLKHVISKLGHRFRPLYFQS